MASIQIKLKIASSALLILTASQCFSFDLKAGHFNAQVGGFVSSQGKTQNIYIQGLLGDQYRVTKHNDGNALFGLGYMLDGPKRDAFNLSYGVNAFYFLNSKVQGTITQEFLYTNLAYHYSMSHLPVYAAVKANMNNHSDKYAVTLDAGIGPNFMTGSNYNDWSIDNGETYPDHAFKGRSNTSFSAMGGIGIKVNNVLGHYPLEIGYRFFYLGDGGLKRRSDQLLNTLKTGTDYAQALMFTVTI